MTSTTATYTAGSGTALVGAVTWALLDIAGDHPLVEALWPAVRAGATLLEVVEVLTRHPVVDLPNLAVVASVGDRHHVLVRGAVVVTSATDPALDGCGLATWAEHRVAAGTDTLCLTLPGSAGGPALPAHVGVVLAGRLDVPLGAAPQPVVSSELSEAREALARSVADLVLAAPPITASETTLTYDDPPAPRAQDEMEPPRDYGHLFEETSDAGPAAAAAPAGPEPEPAPPAAPRVPPAPTPPPLGPPAADRVPRTLIDAVPWRSGNAGEAAAAPPPAPVPPPAGEAVGVPAEARTVSRALVTAAGERIGPLVHAVRCPAGHLNAPHSEACRLCGVPVADQEAVSLPRPVLGVLRLSMDDVVTLDRDVVLGRSPNVPDGPDRPHVVKLNNPSGDVSRNHVAVHLDGWHVLVRDLKSTNGTLVQVPGAEPRLLRPDEQLLIPPGTEVTLADGVSFRYETAQ